MKKIQYNKSIAVPITVSKKLFKTLTYKAEEENMRLSAYVEGVLHLALIDDASRKVLSMIDNAPERKVINNSNRAAKQYKTKLYYNYIDENSAKYIDVRCMLVLKDPALRQIIKDEACIKGHSQASLIGSILYQTLKNVEVPEGWRPSKVRCASKVVQVGLTLQEREALAQYTVKAKRSSLANMIVHVLDKNIRKVVQVASTTVRKARGSTAFKITTPVSIPQWLEEKIAAKFSEGNLTSTFYANLIRQAFAAAGKPLC